MGGYGTRRGGCRACRGGEHMLAPSMLSKERGSAGVHRSAAVRSPPQQALGTPFGEGRSRDCRWERDPGGCCGGWRLGAVLAAPPQHCPAWGSSRSQERGWRGLSAALHRCSVPSRG